jgi:hypothetical protein
MKFRFAAATAALVALSLPTMSSADDKLKYEDLIHCAATNMVIAGVFSLDDGATKNKTQIDTYNGQAAALMAIAAVGSNKESKVVQDDTSKETDAIIAVLADKDKSDGFIKTEVPKCNTLGQAAVEVVNESKTK